MIDNPLIEKYFNNTLNEKELDEFNSLYKTNSNFKSEVEFIKNLKKVTEHQDNENFKKQLQSYDKALSNKHKKKTWLKPLMASAAIIAVIICISFIFNNSINEDALFSSYFEPSKNVTFPIVRSDTNVGLQNDAFIAYSENNFETALNLFESSYKNTNNSELLFYEGNALLALGKTNDAILKFKEHLNYSDRLSNRTHWYLALAYVKNKDLRNAKLQLQLLLKSKESFKNKETKQLLEKIE
ncbi:tetratricopeptide repeat protein [Yeosuana marina]|uniref:hypothetical protein n=1 Tax=Yeosuana marina TaxID=1565536 RepID=UPI00141F9F47|nr:hypothetical protein [Yeosuana marina]